MKTWQIYLVLASFAFTAWADDQLKLESDSYCGPGKSAECNKYCLDKFTDSSPTGVRLSCFEQQGRDPDNFYRAQAILMGITKQEDIEKIKAAASP